MAVPCLYSCDSNPDIYRLGSYSIKADEYHYLLGMQKMQALKSLGYGEKDIDTVIQEGYTLGNYIDAVYSAQFEQSVLTLLFSVALFDEYNLTISEDKRHASNEIINTLLTYYGGYSEKFLDKRLSNLGYKFTTDTLRRVYEMQMKQSTVIEHLYGGNYEKLENEAKEEFCNDYYMHFQVIVINTLYKSHTDSLGKTTYTNLTPEEINVQKRIVTELTELLVNDNKDFNYLIIDPSLSYEELWEKYSDDTLYPQGYFMKKPVSQNVASSATLATAFALKTGDCGVVPAKRYFDGNGSITTENGKEQINAGDYFEYGSAFIKKLDMERDAFTKEENKDFFFPEGSSSFLQQACQYAFYQRLREYESESSVVVEYSKSISQYTISSSKANELDYYYFFGD
jgi:hypothetical protein